MDRLVKPLLPVVMVFAHPAALVDIPDCLREATGPLAEDQERLPAVVHFLVMDSILPVIVQDRQAPDVAEVLGQVGEHLTQVCLPDVSHEQSPRLENP